VLDRQVDVARGDVIASLDGQPMTGLNFEGQMVALQPGGIEPGKRYWLKSGSRRQRVAVEPISQLDLQSGSWAPHASGLDMNAIGKVRLSFEEQAVFDTYEQNRSTGAFILIDPDTLNTVAGGMITAKRGELGGIRRGEPVQGDRVILSLPADLAELLMATDAFAARRDDVEIRRVSGAEAAQILTSGDKDR